MKVTLRCKHRTLTVDAPSWDDLAPVYAADRVRAMLLTCPTCAREASNDLLDEGMLSVAPIPPLVHLHASSGPGSA